MFSVEFLGLPGAGKSHIRDCLISRLNVGRKDKYITAEEAFLQVAKVKIDRVYRLLLKTLPNDLGLKVASKLTNRSIMQFEAQNVFLANWGKSFEAYLSSPVFDILTVNDREIGIADYLYAGAFFECINGAANENRVVFFDEGFLQKSFMFIVPTTTQVEVEPDLIRYLDVIPISDIVVHVRTDIHTCHERMLTRPRGVIRRLKGSSEEDIAHFLKISDRHIQKVVDWIKGRKDTILIEIDNDDEPEDVIQKLEYEISAVLRNQ